MTMMRDAESEFGGELAGANLAEGEDEYEGLWGEAEYLAESGGLDFLADAGAGETLVDPELGLALPMEAADPRAYEGEAQPFADPDLGMAYPAPFEPEAEGFEPEIIPLGSDQRTAVRNTGLVPFRFVCHLLLDFGPHPSGVGRLLFPGTGTLISPRHVLTAGHCLLHTFETLTPVITRAVQSVRVSPGRNCLARRSTIFGSSVARGWVVHPTWRASRAATTLAERRRRGRQFDIGLITLRDPIGTRPQPALGNRPIGFWGSPTAGGGTSIIPRAAQDLRGKRINVSGYPADKCCIVPRASRPACAPHLLAGAQFRATDRVIDPAPAAAPRMLLHSADTMGGHSGSPIWTVYNGRRNLVAVHTGAHVRNVSNRSVRLTPALLRLIRTWMR